jgi:NUMOD3 motif
MDLYSIIFPNGKEYIGIATNAVRRWIQHKSCATHGSKIAVHCAIRKYGAEAAKQRVLVRGSAAYIRALETKAIARFGTLAPNGYNVTPGGEISAFSLPQFRTTSEGMRQRFKDNPYHKQRFLEGGKKSRWVKGHRTWNLGKKFSEESRAKMSRAKLGKKQSAASIAKRAIATSLDWQRPARRASFSESMRGRRFITDGITERIVKPDFVLPPGWSFGHLRRKKAKRHAAT